MRKTKKISLLIIIISFVLLLIGFLLTLNINNSKDSNVKYSDEHDLDNIDNFYLERYGGKLSSVHKYGDYEFSDVSFSGSHDTYLFLGSVKKKNNKKIEHITFDIIFLDEFGNEKYNYIGICSFDENNVGIVHSETTENIALYYDYKITNIKEK